MIQTMTAHLSDLVCMSQINEPLCAPLQPPFERSLDKTGRAADTPVRGFWVRQREGEYLVPSEAILGAAQSCKPCEKLLTLAENVVFPNGST